jgi:Kip1 ubiquitination-promoting complex protein 1
MKPSKASSRIAGRSSFSTVRANVCVFKGRWMYEVQLGSAGIIQLGWTTLGARYTAEEGIGDSDDRWVGGRAGQGRAGPWSGRVLGQGGPPGPG